MLKIKNIRSLTILRECTFKMINEIFTKSQAMLAILLVVIVIGDAVLF